MSYSPHDLVWVDSKEFFEFNKKLPNWVYSEFSSLTPLVIRREVCPNGLLPVGVRGFSRDKRLALYIPKCIIKYSVSPEELFISVASAPHIFNFLAGFKATESLEMIINEKNSFLPIGLTGGVAFSVAVKKCMININSDLDIRIKSSSYDDKEMLTHLYNYAKRLPSKVDIQVEVGAGAFSLSEWIRSKKVMIKGERGVYMTSNPWEDCSVMVDVV